MSRKQGVMQCREIIQERVIALKHELATIGQSQSDRVKASDRAAIMELRHLEKLLGHIEHDYPRGGKHPYLVAQSKSGWSRKGEIPSVMYGEDWWWNPQAARSALTTEASE